MFVYQNTVKKRVFTIIVCVAIALFFIAFKKKPLITKRPNVRKNTSVVKYDVNVKQTDYKNHDGKYTLTSDVKQGPLEGKQGIA